MKLDRSVRWGMRRYLRRVGRAARHLGVRERRELLENIEGHIREALQARADRPGREDLIAVLDTMDPPDAYAVEGAEDVVPRGLGRVGLLVVASGFGLAVILVLVAVIGFGERGASIAVVATFVAFAGALAGIVLGALGFREPAGKAAVICGVVILLAALFLVPIRRSEDAPRPSPFPTETSAFLFGSDLMPEQFDIGPAGENLHQPA